MGYKYEARQTDKHWLYRIGDDQRWYDKHGAAKIIGIECVYLSQITQKHKGAEAFDKKMRKVEWLVRNNISPKTKVFSFNGILTASPHIAMVTGISQSAASYRLRQAIKRGFDLAWLYQHKGDGLKVPKKSFGDCHGAWDTNARERDRERRRRNLSKIPSPSRFERVHLTSAGAMGVQGREAGGCGTCSLNIPDQYGGFNHGLL